jgi:outer membrane protein TolC
VRRFGLISVFVPRLFFWLLSVGAGVGTVAAHAQEPSPQAPLALPFAQAVDRLLAGNHDVRRAQLRVEQARVASDAALAPFDTLLGAQLRATRAAQPTDEGLSSGRNVSERIDLGFSLGRAFPVGLRLQVALDMGRARSEFPISSEFFNDTIVSGPNFSSALSTTLTQPLLRGRGRAVNLLPATLARLDADVADASVFAAASGVLTTLLERTVELEFAWTEYRASLAAAERSRAHLLAAEAEVAAGRTAEIELDLVRARILAAEEAELLAWAAIVEQSAAISALWGERQAEPMQLERAPTAQIDPTAHGLCQLAADTNPALIELGATLAVARARVAIPRDARRSQLDLSAGVTWSGLDERLDTTLAQVLTLRATTIFGLLSWSMPVTGRQSRAELERAELDAEAIEIELASARHALCLQLDANARAFDLLGERELLAQQRLELARRSQQAEATRFAQGYSTVQAGIDVLQQLDDAELEIARIARDRELLRVRAGSVAGLLPSVLLSEARSQP